ATAAPAVRAPAPPAAPAVVNVSTAPGGIAATVHRYSVPDTACVTTGVATPLGSIAVAPTTIADSVSATTRFAAVAVPRFATTIRYCTTDPDGAGDTTGCTSVFTVVITRVSGCTVNVAAATWTAVCAHALPPAVYTVLLTVV